MEVGESGGRWVEVGGGGWVLHEKCLFNTVK